MCLILLLPVLSCSSVLVGDTHGSVRFNPVICLPSCAEGCKGLSEIRHNWDQKKTFTRGAGRHRFHSHLR